MIIVRCHKPIRISKTSFRAINSTGADVQEEIRRQKAGPKHSHGCGNKRTHICCIVYRSCAQSTNLVQFYTNEIGPVDLAVPFLLQSLCVFRGKHFVLQLVSAHFILAVSTSGIDCPERCFRNNLLCVRLHLEHTQAVKRGYFVWKWHDSVPFYTSDMPFLRHFALQCKIALKKRDNWLSSRGK